MLACSRDEASAILERCATLTYDSWSDIDPRAPPFVAPHRLVHAKSLQLSHATRYYEPRDHVAHGISITGSPETRHIFVVTAHLGCDVTCALCIKYTSSISNVC